MKKMKRPLSLALCLAVLLSLLALTGCGGGSSSGGSSGGNTEPETPTGTVYVSSFTPIDRSFTNGLSYLIYHDGRFLTASYEMIADNTPEGVTPEWEGQYWEYGYVFYWLSLDGSMEKLENYAPLKVQEMEAVEGGYSDSYTNAICIAQDGSIITLDNVYCSYYDGPEGISQDSEEYWNYYVYEESYYIRHLAQDGTELSCAELTGVTEDENEYFYPYGMVLGDDGDLYVICDDKLLILDTEGKLLYKISTDNYFESIVRLNDGSIAVIHYGESGYELTYVDTENKALGESVELNGNIYRIFTGGGAYDFYYTNGSNFFGYDLESGSATKLFNWINCDVNSDNSDNLAILPDGRVVCVTSDWNDDYSEVSCELVTIEEKPAASVPQKTTLTFATMYLSYDIRDLIIDFNKKNTQYRIEVRDYSEYNTEDDYSAGQTKLTTEILSGNVPDIIDLNGMPTERMAAKGLLQDLYPYLDSDSELSRDDFFANVLAALEIDGALYRTVSTFSISTVIGASSVVGDEPGWTLDEFKAAYARMPEGCTVFNEYVTQSDILSQTLAFEMDSLVNWATGECSFDSDTFKNILAFADSFPSEFDWENWDYNESGGTVSRLQSGRQMLMTANISDFEDPQLYHALFGTDITCIGYPTENGIGNSFQFNGSELAMSSKCQNKDAAWEFLRSFFTASSQRRLWGFPVNKNAFDEALKDAMTPEYQKDENGNYVLDENGDKIEVSKGGWGYDDVMVEVYALTQEQADEILKLIESTTRTVDYDSQEIIEMVTQEAEPYFAGQKSLDEVARLVQSKVNIFVNEQR